MRGKILVSEQPGSIGFRSEQGIIRPEPGSARSSHVLVGPECGIQQAQDRRQRWEDAFFPAVSSGTGACHEHHQRGHDQGQVCHALVKPGGKPGSQEKIASPQSCGQPSGKSGAGHFISPYEAKAKHQQRGCQKTRRNEKGVPFSACRSGGQGSIKQGQQCRQRPAGGGFCNAWSGRFAGRRFWHGLTGKIASTITAAGGLAKSKLPACTWSVSRTGPARDKEIAFFVFTFILFPLSHGTDLRHFFTLP